MAGKAASALSELLGGDAAARQADAQEAARMEAARVERVKRAKADFGYFCSTYLPHYFTSEPAEYQRILNWIENEQAVSERNCERLKRFIKPAYHGTLRPIRRLAGMVDVEPREHGKTVRGSFAKPLWRLLTGQNRFILLIGATQAAANSNIIDIRTELEDNEALIADFGDQKSRGKKWTDDRLELVNGTCLQAKGAGAAMRGVRFRQYRPDLVVLDDLMKDEAAESPAWREKIHRWTKRVVFLLGKHAFILFVNTIFHGDDIVCRLLAEIERGDLDDWVGLRFSCWKPDGSPLWPEHWSAGDLEAKRRNLGTAVFSTEMENEPLSDAERIIRIEWIRAHWYPPAACPPLESLRRFIGVDPSVGSHDQAGLVTIGVDARGLLWELDSWGRTVSETGLVEALSLKYLVFRPEAIGWEEVAFQTIYKRYVMRLAAEKGLYLPIHGVKTGGVAKEARIRRLSPLIENGILRLREKGAEELVDQLWNFPKHPFDDQPDALEIAVRVSEAGGIGPLAFPFRTPTRVQRILGGRRPGARLHDGMR